MAEGRVSEQRLSLQNGREMIVCTSHCGHCVGASDSPRHALTHNPLTPTVITLLPTPGRADARQRHAHALPTPRLRPGSQYHLRVCAPRVSFLFLFLSSSFRARQRPRPAWFYTKPQVRGEGKHWGLAPPPPPPPAPRRSRPPLPWGLGKEKTLGECLVLLFLIMGCALASP